MAGKSDEAPKLDIRECANSVIERASALVGFSDFSPDLLDRLHKFKKELVLPLLRELKREGDERGAGSSLAGLYKAVEDYGVFYLREPGKREERRRHAETYRRRLRRALTPGSGREAEVEKLLDEMRQWQWRTSLDEKGRLVYSTGKGAVVPARGDVVAAVGPEVIEQAIKAQTPYSDELRPRDSRGEPGGLVKIGSGKRLLVVGDLHGRYDNLQHILRDKQNIKGVIEGTTHLVFTGDAVHPRSSRINDAEAYEDSFCVMLLIMTLKAENPANVHYLIGNHDNALVGGRKARRGLVRQDAAFEEFLVAKFGEQVLNRYKTFVAGCPVVMKMKAGDGYLMLVHAGLGPEISSEEGLIEIFVMGRQSPAMQQLLWRRNYELDSINRCLETAGVNFIITGHTNPTPKRAERYGFKMIASHVFGHVHQKQAIVNAQGNAFGYLNVDLTAPLPERIVDLKAPDGKPAFRVLKPRRSH